jgi:hypothetical protein
MAAIAWSRALVECCAAPWRCCRAASLAATASIWRWPSASSALHASAPTAAATDWPQIAALYGELRRHIDSSIIQLNHAVAVSMASGPKAGLHLLEPLADALSAFAPFHLARADMLRRTDQMEKGFSVVGPSLDSFYNQARVASLDPVEGGLVWRVHRRIVRFEQEGIWPGWPVQNEHVAFDEPPNTAGVDAQLDLVHECIFQLFIAHRSPPALCPSARNCRLAQQNVHHRML